MSESGRSSGASRSAVAAFALVATILAVHAPWQGANLTAHHDNLDGAAPLRVEAARQWKQGHVPLWNPYKRGGMPLLADTTAGAIYPLNFPFLLAGDPDSAPEGSSPVSDAPVFDAPVFDAMDRVAALHAVLAALGMFALLKAAGLGRAAALFGGLVYGACGTMGWLAAWYIQMQDSVAWLPWILLAVLRASSPGADFARWTTLGAVSVALQFFAGYPETSFYSGLLAIGFAAALSSPVSRWRPFVAVAAIYGAGLLLSAVQLLPSVELQLASRRPGALDLATFQSLPASLSMVKSWAMPGAGTPFDFPPVAGTHFGIAAVLAAIAGITGMMGGLLSPGSTRSRLAAYLTAVLLAGFLLAVGPATPVSAWAWHVPGLSAFRHPFKHLFEVSFAMAGLAAVGLSLATTRNPRPGWATPVCATMIAFTAVVLRINQAALVAGNPVSVDVSGRTPAVVAKLEPGWRTMTLRQVFQKRDPSFLIGDYPTQFRVAAVHGAGPYLWTELATATGLIEEETTFRRGLFGRGDRTLALLSCRYVVQTRAGKGFAPAVDPDAWRPLLQAPDLQVMERDDALPRLRFVSSAACASADQVRVSLAGNGPDPRDVALLDCAPGETLPALRSADGLDVRVVDERAGRLVLATDIPPGNGAMLVVSQSALPGWRATADGAEVAVRRVHGLVQGLVLPGGTRSVELEYAPASVKAGAAASATTLLLLLAACVATGRRDATQA